MRKLVLAIAVGGMMALPACSSRPREFAPNLTMPMADPRQFEADVATCRQLLVDGKLDTDGRAGSAAAGAGAATAVGAVGTAAATSAGFYTGMAVASATLVALPIVAIGGAWGMAKSKQKKKEAAIQRAMTGCLAERGHAVAGWTRVKKTKQPERTAAED